MVLRTPAAMNTAKKTQSPRWSSRPSIFEARKPALKKLTPTSWYLNPKKPPRLEAGIYSPISTDQGGLAALPATV